MINKDIENDIKKIASTAKAEEVLLFGSYLKGTQSEKSDIDIALVIDQPVINELREKLTKLNLSTPVSARKMNGSYGPALPELSVKHFHVIVLNKNENNSEFLKRSSAHILMANKKIKRDC